MGRGGRPSDWSNWRFDRICPLIGQCLFQSHSTCFCVWSQTDTATAAKRCTMPCCDSSRQVHTSMSRWAFLLRHNRRFQVFRPAVPRKSSHFREFFLRWHAGQRSQNDVFVCHWRLANPDSMAPSLIQIACWHGRVLVHHSFSKWQHLARVPFPKNTHKRRSPVDFHLLKSRRALRGVSNQPRYQDAVVWLLQEILK